MNAPITKVDVEAEEWAACLKYPKCEVTCANDHVFFAHSKFSGRLIAIVSHAPCPVCGSYSLKRASSGVERQVIDSTVKGNVNDV